MYGLGIVICFIILLNMTSVVPFNIPTQLSISLCPLKWQVYGTRMMMMMIIIIIM